MEDEISLIPRAKTMQNTAIRLIMEVDEDTNSTQTVAPGRGHSNSAPFMTKSSTKCKMVDQPTIDFSDMFSEGNSKP